jgi:hypothetical protein
VFLAVSLAGFYWKITGASSSEDTAKFIVSDFSPGTFFHCHQIFPETEMADAVDSDKYHGLRVGSNFSGGAD